MTKIKVVNLILTVLVAFVIVEAGALAILLNDSSESSDDMQAETQKAEMANYLIRTSAELQNELMLIDNATAGAASDLQGNSLNGSQTRTVLDSVIDASDNILNVVTTDINGTILAVEPSQYSSIEGTDIGYQETMMIALGQGRPAISPLYDVVEGFDAVYIVYPVFDGEGKINGSISTMFRPDLIMTKIIEEHENSALGAMVMQRDGIVLYDPDPDQVGRNTFTDPLYQNFTEIKSIASRMVNESSGSGKYSFQSSGEAVSKSVMWTTVGLMGTQWTVAVNRAE